MRNAKMCALGAALAAACWGPSAILAAAGAGSGARAGDGGRAAAPSFSSTGVVNASGYQNKLAPGAAFVVFGADLGPASLVAGAAPYATELGGTSITFTPAAGGAAISARIIYTAAKQVAGLLPSSIAPGSYAVRVTYNAVASAPQTVTVAARSFGIATANSAGSGTAQATIGNVNGGVSLLRLTSGSVAFGGLTWTLTPAHPGDTLVLWGTGGGADQANDAGGSSGDQTDTGNFVVTVGGRQVKPLYAGASAGYPGLWQINFTLPGDITPDCFAPLQVTAGGEASNQATVPIAAAGQSACADPQLSREALAALDGGGAIALGGFGVARVTLSALIVGAGNAVTTYNASQEVVNGGIGKYTAAQYAALNSGVKIDACRVQDRTGPSDEKAPNAPDSYLDGGSPLPFSGPGVPAGAGLTVAVTNPGPVYQLLLPAGGVTPSGRYTLSGPGGSGMGAFNVSVTMPAAFAVTGFDSLTTIDRARPLTINWTGGSEQVYIVLNTWKVVGKSSTNSNILHSVTITCQTPAAAGSYTIPTAALAYLVPAGVDAASLATGAGILAVQSVTTQEFRPQVFGGAALAYAALTGTLSVSKNVTVQ